MRLRDPSFENWWMEDQNYLALANLSWVFDQYISWANFWRWHLLVSDRTIFVSFDPRMIWYFSYGPQILVKLPLIHQVCLEFLNGNFIIYRNTKSYKSQSYTDIEIPNDSLKRKLKMIPFKNFSLTMQLYSRRCSDLFWLFNGSQGALKYSFERIVMQKFLSVKKF